MLLFTKTYHFKWVFQNFWKSEYVVEYVILFLQITKSLRFSTRLHAASARHLIKFRALSLTMFDLTFDSAQNRFLWFFLWLRRKKMFWKDLLFSLEVCHFTSKSNFPAYIRDNEIGLFEFFFDLGVKRCFEKAHFSLSKCATLL